MAPWGLAGGESGARGRNAVERRDGRVEEVGGKDTRSMEAGDRLLIETPGGGVTEDKLSPEEKLARERQRMLALGVTSYAWAKRAERMLLPLTGEIWVQDGIDAKLRLLVGKAEDPRPALDPSLSADGQQVAFVRGGELWVVPADASAAPRQLTSGGAEQGKVRGLAEYIAAEEMDRHRGYWWSPDASQPSPSPSEGYSDALASSQSSPPQAASA